MASSRFLRICWIFGCLAACKADKDWPCDHVKDPIDRRPSPVVPPRFHAVVETVFTYPRFTEFATYSLDYDQERNRAALANVGSSGTSERSRRIIDYALNQTFLIESGKEMRCEVIRPADDDANHVFKNFPGVFKSISPGQIFAPEQFFGMVELDLFGYVGKRVLHNNMTCDVWAYCVDKNPDDKNPDTTKNVFVYWAEEGWQGTGSTRQPMGVIWRQKKPSADEADEVIMTVADFQAEYVNATAFEVPKGDVCVGVKSKPFPQFLNTDVFRFKTEIHVPVLNLITFSEYWIDMFHDYVRNIMEMPLASKSSGIQVSTIDYKRKVVFLQKNEEFNGCEVKPMETEVSEIESITNLHLLSQYNVSFFLQPPGVDWIYVGQQHHRSIATDVWQAKRTDWPPGYQGVTSAWEWHMANVSTQKMSGGVFTPVDQVTPVHLRVTILESVQHWMPKGSILLFHLYDFKMEKSGTNDLYDFDVSSCYREEWKQHIRFRVKITGQGLNNKNRLERYVRNPSFRLQWQDTIALFLFDGNLLRISQLQSFVNENQEVVIQFWLLSKHPDIDAEINDNDLDDARLILLEAINGAVSFGEEMGTPIAGSLEDVALDCHQIPVRTTTPSDAIPTTTPSDAIPTTTPSDAIPTTSSSQSRTFLPTSLPTTASLKEGTFSSGVAVAVSIGLLIAGITTGGGITLLMVIKNIPFCVWLRNKKW